MFNYCFPEECFPDEIVNNICCLIYFTNSKIDINQLEYMIKQILKNELNEIIFLLEESLYKKLNIFFQKYNIKYLLLNKNHNGTADAISMVKNKKKCIFFDANKCCFYIESILKCIIQNIHNSNFLLGNSFHKSFFHNEKIIDAVVLNINKEYLNFIRKESIYNNFSKNIIIANNICVLDQHYINIINKYLETNKIQNLLHYDKINTCIYDALNYLVINNLIKIKVFEVK